MNDEGKKRLANLLPHLAYDDKPQYDFSKLGDSTDFRLYFLVYKTDEGLFLEFYDTLGELYHFINEHSEIIGYSVFRTLEICCF